ncbi:MAG: pilus assembly protein N-terminal domain-containing protein [Isosphaeraceae bacterium]
MVLGPAAELNLVVGRSKLIDTRQPYPQILIANPAVADVQLLDRESPQLLNLYGFPLRFPTTLTLFDPANRDRAPPVRDLATIDGPDLERRIAQLFPGAQVSYTSPARR